jgi:hypothetical protein
LSKFKFDVFVIIIKASSYADGCVLRRVSC